MIGSPRERGWTWLHNSRKWHYFVGGRSVCGKFGLLGQPELLAGDDGSPDNCAACKRAVAKLRTHEDKER